VDRFGTPPVVSLVECWLETGRTHQIRVHMAHTGHGLVGDPVYGGRRKISHKSLTPNAVQAIQGFDRQALHAAVLGFEHPVSGDMMRFEADLPTDMITLLSNL
jgi:23S rRNA pseudouridine1911/1915/1917 synthase